MSVLIVADDGSSRGRDAVALAEEVAQTWDVRSVVAGPFPETGTGTAEAAGPLADLARAEDARAIVIGAPRSAGWRRAGVGSTAVALLHRARCPILVAPVGYAHAGPRGSRGTVGVTWAGSPPDAAVLAAARALAGHVGDDVRIVEHAEALGGLGRLSVELDALVVGPHATAGAVSLPATFCPVLLLPPAAAGRDVAAATAAVAHAA